MSGEPTRLEDLEGFAFAEVRNGATTSANALIFVRTQLFMETIHFYQDRLGTNVKKRPKSKREGCSIQDEPAMAWLIEYRDGFRAALFILNGFLSGMICQCVCRFLS